MMNSKRTFQYGNCIMGWVPSGSQSGGRFVMFKDYEEYERLYGLLSGMEVNNCNCVYVAEEKQEKKLSLDQLIANAKISGGKCRHELNRRRR